jgi:F-box/leucine-rich repeat protein 10/11
VRPRRSPTPPTGHVEPLSPSVSKLRALEPNFNYPATTNNVFGYGLQPQPRRQNVPVPTPARARAQSDYHRGHGRKPSNIDTLAEAALALSPGFVVPPSGYSRPNGQGHAYPAYPPSTEPPHKRARSAYFAPPQVGQHASRPATSYEGSGWTNGAPASAATYESRLEEASLLLNFRTGGWPTSISSSQHQAPRQLFPFRSLLSAAHRAGLERRLHPTAHAACACSVTSSIQSSAATDPLPCTQPPIATKNERRCRAESENRERQTRK